MTNSQAHVLTVSTSTLDDTCKATLNKMLSNGWNKANTEYTTTKTVLSPMNLSHLLKHGGIALRSGPVSSLKSYEVIDVGSDVRFTLNVDLI